MVGAAESNSTQAAWLCLETLKSRRELEDVVGMDEERGGFNGRMQKDALHWRDIYDFGVFVSSHDGFCHGHFGGGGFELRAADKFSRPVLC